MKEENKIKIMQLYGGPNDGEQIEIHEDNLKIKPIISIENKEGDVTEYALNNQGRFIWLKDHSDENRKRQWFVCDDNGNVISEEKDIDDAFATLDNFNNKH